MHKTKFLFLCDKEKRKQKNDRRKQGVFQKKCHQRNHFWTISLVRLIIRPQIDPIKRQDDFVCNMLK